MQSYYWTPHICFPIMVNLVTHGQSSFMTYKSSKSAWPWLWPFNATKIKCNVATGLPIYNFLLVFNSDTWPNSTPLHDISLRNLSGLDIDLSRSLRSNVIMLLDFPNMVSYECLLVTHGLSWLLYGICLQTRVTLILTFQGHKVKCVAAIQLFIYELLSISYSNSMSIP